MLHRSPYICSQEDYNLTPQLYTSLIFSGILLFNLTANCLALWAKVMKSFAQKRQNNNLCDFRCVSHKFLVPGLSRE